MTSTRKSSLTWSGALTLSAVLLFTSGCMVGPKYKAPAPPQVTGYTPAPIATTSATPNIAGGEAQKFISGQDIPGEWWTVFHSKPLDDLIERALKANPDIKAAQATLLVARENLLAQRGAYFPNLSAGFSADHSKTSDVVSSFTSNGALTYSLYTPQVAVSFVPDVFGLNRRTVESLGAQEQQARYALAATHITLSSNVAAAAIQEASLRAQINATRELITINTVELKILREQFNKGYVSRLDVAAQESQAGPSRGDAAAFAQATGAAARSPCRAHRRISRQGSAREIRVVEPATSPGTSSQSSFAASRAAPRRAPGRSQSALSLRPDWSRTSEQAAQLHADQ